MCYRKQINALNVKWHSVKDQLELGCGSAEKETIRQTKAGIC